MVLIHKYNKMAQETEYPGELNFILRQAGLSRLK